MSEPSVKGRSLAMRLILIAVLLFQSSISPVELCTRTASLPETVATTETTASTAAVTTTEATTTTTTTAPLTCTLGSKKFGKYSPAPGSVLTDGQYAIVQCNPGTQVLDDTVLITQCRNGKLTSTSDCLPCPDSSWIFDSTTNRCFKGFTAFSLYAGPCDFTMPCATLSLTYGVPADVAYTTNFKALIEAGTNAFNGKVTPSNQYFVGIGDPSSNFNYELKDGTSVVLTDILPFFQPNQPDDTSVNTQQFMVIGANDGTNIGFDDTTCNKNFGAICQLQLTA